MPDYTLITKEEVLKLNNFPYIVLSSDLSSWIAYKIRSHSKYGYSHSMWYANQGKFASQDWRMKEVPIENYFNGSTRLKFWTNKYWNTYQKIKLFQHVRESLEKRGSYDWLGILGQLVGWSKLNFSNKNFCSEEIGNGIREVDRNFLSQTKIDIITKINSHYNPLHPSPSDLDIYFSNSLEDGYESFVFDPTL